MRRALFAPVSLALVLTAYSNGFKRSSLQSLELLTNLTGLCLICYDAGIDIDAGCVQLKADLIRKRKSCATPAVGAPGDGNSVTSSTSTTQPVDTIAASIASTVSN